MVSTFLELNGGLGCKLGYSRSSRATSSFYSCFQRSFAELVQQNAMITTIGQAEDNSAGL
jgi:hypothetical protein